MNRKTLIWIAFGCLLIGIVLLGRTALSRLKNPHAALLAKREAAMLEVVMRIENGSLKIEDDGAIALPDDMAFLSVHKSVYITEKAGGVKIYLFPIWYGKGFNYQGFVYSKEELNKWGQSPIFAGPYHNPAPFPIPSFIPPSPP